MIGAKIVDDAVILTDKGVSPLERKVMTFDAVPPGQQPTRITPTATSGGNCKPTANAKAMSGMMTNCAPTPMATSFGLLNTSLKSCVVSVNPIPNMTTPSSMDMYGAIQIKVSGEKNAIMANAKTQMANVLPTN
ncbi:hypothetical protein GCM10028868_07150 [Virgibacillus kimchii]